MKLFGERCQGEMVLKYLPFFRTAIEKSIPALLRLGSCKRGQDMTREKCPVHPSARQTLEPLPRVISFLEPYGEV